MWRLLLLSLFVIPIAGAQERSPVKVTGEALRIHRSAIVVDGHNDLPWKVRERAESSFEKLDIAAPQPGLHTDIARLRAGGVGAQFWAAFVPVETIEAKTSARYCLEQIDLIHRMVRRYPETFEMAYSADDILRARGKGRIASLIGIEGGHAIENSLAALRMFHRLGARYMTLTHTKTLDWADAAGDEARHGGLTEFGEQVVREMNRLGMLVDISHVSADTMRDVLRVTQAPVIASHSSAYALRAHPRNVPDDVLRLVAKNGGVVMVNFYPRFIIEQGNGSVHIVVDHIDHIAQVAGVDHVGLGSDFDGINAVAEQLEDVSCFPNVTQELLNRGYAQEAIRKILGENLLRAFREAEAVCENWNRD